jgi:hypothetical protein
MPDVVVRIRDAPQAVWVVNQADRVTKVEQPPSSWTSETRRAWRAEALTIRAQRRGASMSLEARLDDQIAAHARWCAGHR